MGDLDKMQGKAIAVVGLAVVTLVGLAIITQFKTSALITNATADLFIAGLTIFGTFMSIIVLALVGKIIIGLFTKSGTE